VKLWLKDTKKTKDKDAEHEVELDFDRVKYDLERKSEKRSIIIVITLLVLFIIFLSSVIYFAGEPKTSHLSAYNDRWNDISKFREHMLDQNDRNGNELYETSSILSSATILKQVENPSEALYVAIGIEKEYSADQVEAIIDFVSSGGSAIIADDFGYGNSISQAVLDTDETFNVGFVGKPLWDENYLKNPRFIKINLNIAEGGMDFNGVILLNDPTALEPRKTERYYDLEDFLKNRESKQAIIETVVTSSDKGWVDMDGDGKHSPFVAGEEMGEKPIIQVAFIGRGRAMFISDPSLFINDMWNRENNSEFISALVHYLLPNLDEETNLRLSNGAKLIIFDESLHVQEDLLSNARLTFFQGLVILTTDTQLAILIGILLLLILGVIIIIIENPPDLRHRFNIDYYTLNNLITSDITAADCDRIRYIFLEKLRISHGLSIEDFKDLSYDELENLIREPDLVSFALDWKKKYYGQELENILIKIRDFE
jgi:hypothetical protein